MKKLSILLCGLLGFALAANAIPAKRGFRTYTQADGTTVELELRGDEHSHYYVTDDNVPVICGVDGVYRYASVDMQGKLELSEVPAANSRNRDFAGRAAASKASLADVQALMSKRAQERLSVAEAPSRVAPQSGMGLFTGSYPRTGKVHGIIFLVEYQDVKFTLEDPHDYFTRMLNEEGFSDNGATGSARDYFLDQSNKQFDVTFDVYGPVTLSQNRKYYGGNDMFGNDAHAEEMVTEAASLLQNEIDFSQYDYDNNGNVDNIFVIYAGEGEADGGSSETVWPHSWEIPNGTRYNGKMIKGYACANECRKSGGSMIPTGIGTVCHEFSHVMGLPDLYVTTGSGSWTPGSWSVLDYGPYNNDGRTPPNYSAYERNAMGWIDPYVLDGPETILLKPIHDSNAACLIQTNKTNEFFLLENRQKEGWDKYLPYHGMLVWHIDFVQSVFDANRVNNTKSHQYVDIVEANDNPNNGSLTALKGFPFPGSKGITSFTSETSPALKSWTNVAIDLPITNITEENGNIKFDVAGGTVNFERPAAPVLTANDKGEITITWTKDEMATGYYLNVYSKNGGKAITLGEYKGYIVEGASIITVEGAKGNTEYFATIQAFSGRSKSEVSPEGSVVTGKIDMQYITPAALNMTRDDNNLVTMEWDAVEDAASYLLTVQTETVGGTQVVTYGFGEGDNLELPEGWDWGGTTSDVYTSRSTGYYGEEAPSLKFKSSDTSLTTSVMAGNISEVSFWLRGASTMNSNRFIVNGRKTEDDSWIELFVVEPLSQYTTAGSTLTFTPDRAIRQLKFVYDKIGSGNVAFDDLKLSVPGLIFVPVGDYDRHDVGTATSHQAQLDANAGTIRFFVEAVDSKGTISKASNAITLVSGQNSGIECIETDSEAPVEYFNLQGIRTTPSAPGIYIRRQGASTSKIIMK